MAEIRQNIVNGQGKKKDFAVKNNDDHDNTTMPNKKKPKNIANILCITTEDFLLTHEK